VIAAASLRRGCGHYGKISRSEGWMSGLSRTPGKRV
jgi:hypothetical protein